MDNYELNSSIFRISNVLINVISEWIGVYEYKIK